MPVYKDNAANRRLGRVGKKFGKGVKTGPEESTRYGKFAKKEETEKTSNWSDKNNTKKEKPKIMKKEEPAATKSNTKRRKLERMDFKGDKKDVPLLVARGKKKKKIAKGKKTKLDEAGVRKGIKRIERKKYESDREDRISYDPDDRSDKLYTKRKPGGKPTTLVEDALSKDRRNDLAKARDKSAYDRKMKSKKVMGMSKEEYEKMLRRMKY